MPSSSRTRVGSPPAERPLLIWDGDCAFCRRWIARWRRATAGRVDYAPWQQAAARFPEIPQETFRRSVVLILVDGTVVTGAEAVVRSLACAPRRRWPLALYERVPAAARLMESLYKLVASHRVAFSRMTRLVWGDDLLPPTYTTSGGLFLRLVGLTYLIAFLSLWVQVDGLIGTQGILPLSPYLDWIGRHSGWERYWEHPTLFWLGSGDAALHAVCGAGSAISLMAVAGVAPVACLAALWLLYLSLVTAGRTFLGFQWDNLLLEAGLLAALMAPLTWRSALRSGPPPARIPFELARLLTFRLMFSSGLVKLTSADPAWWGLTALEVHYETQPLPAWTSWYAHQMPGWFQRGSIVLMFVIELLAPFALFFPRRLRHAGIGSMLGLQLLIALTGNYGFFNLLASALCLLFLDDSFWPARWRGPDRPAAGRTLPGRALVLPGSILLLLGMLALLDASRVPILWPGPVAALRQAAAPFRSVNGYGLFARMTTERPEIVVEGSRDGSTWRPYVFRWKPGDPARRPAFMQPHMPRLDWQMWFAALGSYRSTPWFGHFLARLLEGSPPVLGLLEENPFPDAPPRYVRAVLYDYRFTRRDDGSPRTDWWRRREMGPYSPTLALEPRQGR